MTTSSCRMMTGLRLGIEAGGLGGGQGGVGRGRSRGWVVDRGPSLLLSLPVLHQPPISFLLNLVASGLQMRPARDSCASHFLENKHHYYFADSLFRNHQTRREKKFNRRVSSCIVQLNKRTKTGTLKTFKNTNKKKNLSLHTTH